jgi:hypothetical protein
VLIHLDGSAAADAVSTSATAACSRACIEDLLLAHFRGHHVVSLVPSDAATLRAVSSPWSERAHRALDHIDENYAQIAGLREEVAWSLELGIGSSFDGKAHDAGGGTKILRAPLHAFQKGHATACSVLLGENATDAELFHQLGLMRQAERRWDQLGMVHERHGGGGSTIAMSYRGFADQGRILLAIADTDRRYPEDSAGGTYTNLMAEAAGRPDYQRARPIPTRTAEGLVPMRVYREVFQSKNGDQRLGRVMRLEQLLCSAPSDILQYAHLKDGIRLYQIQYPKNEAEGSYWSGVAKNAKRDQCAQLTSKQCTQQKDCLCEVVEGLGANALSDVVTWMKTRKSKRDLASRFGLHQNRELSELADEVLAWGLALSPLLT